MPFTFSLYKLEEFLNYFRSMGSLNPTASWIFTNIFEIFDTWDQGKTLGAVENITHYQRQFKPVADSFWYLANLIQLCKV